MWWDGEYRIGSIGSIGSGVNSWCTIVSVTAWDLIHWGFTCNQCECPDETDGADGSYVGGYVAQRKANGIPAIDRDKGERHHGNGHRNGLRGKSGFKYKEIMK